MNSAPRYAAVKELLALVQETSIQFELSFEHNEQLLFLGVGLTARLAEMETVIEPRLGPPLKPRGRRALLRNVFDPFVRRVGGIRRDQSLFRKDAGEGLVLFAAFWPWATRPDRVSVRIGLLYPDRASLDALLDIHRSLTQI